MTPMDDLERAMLEQAVNEIRKLRETTRRAKEAHDAALRIEHAAIRELLKTGPTGTQKYLVEQGLYSRPHLDRIRRGKTSG